MSFFKTTETSFRKKRFARYYSDMLVFMVFSRLVKGVPFDMV